MNHLNAILPSNHSQHGLILIFAILVGIAASLVVLGLACIPEYYQRVVTHTVPTFSSRVLLEVSNATIAAQASARSMDLTTFAVYTIIRNVVITLFFEIVAALLVWKAQGEWFRWFTALVLAFVPTGVLWVFGVVAQLDTQYIGFATLLWPGILLYLYLFPNGKAVPRWTRWPMGALVLFHFLVILGSVLTPLIPGLNPSQEVAEQIVFIILLGLPFILVCQIYRYRRISTLTERLQTRWVLAGLSFFILSSLIISGFSLVNFTRDTGFGTDIILLLILFLPFTIGVSVLRYRLFDIDVIIHKTLVYALVTGLLALVYFSVVMLLEAAFAELGAGQSPAAIVLSTLAIVVLFNPLRKRVQTAVDRRFYRKKYDAEQVLAAFSATLREEVDLNHLKNSILGVVEETMQPMHVSLWLREVDRKQRKQQYEK